MKIAISNIAYEKEVISTREESAILVKLHKEANCQTLQTDLNRSRCGDKEARWLKGKGILSYG